MNKKQVSFIPFNTEQNNDGNKNMTIRSVENYLFTKKMAGPSSCAV